MNQSDLKVEIKNLGLIKEANIDLSGLTVLAGLNDVGKSFISRIVFSIVKTINQAAQQYLSDRYESFHNSINQILNWHRQYVPYTVEKQNRFNVNSIVQKAQQAILLQTVPTDDIVALIRSWEIEINEDIEQYLSKNAATLQPQQKSNVVNIKNIIKSYFSQILNSILIPASENDKYKNYFDKQVIQRTFQEQLNTILPTGISGEPVKIKIKSGEVDIVNIEVVNNKTTVFEVLNPPFLLKDATLIDTPTIINFERYITQSLAFGTIRQESLLYPYYNDILPKLGVLLSRAPQQSIFSDLFNDIKKIIKGSWTFNQQTGGITFQKENGTKLRPFNVATGIKSFGLLQMLLNYYEVSGIPLDNVIIIIDEPEVHLHPAWELGYAKLLVKLSELGAKILVSTHSPYLVEAILDYTQDGDKPSERVRFYLGDISKEDGLSYFRNDTADVDPIFEKFAEPMQSLN